MTYMDDEMFDTEAIGDQDNTVGGIRPFEAIPGQQVDGVFWFRRRTGPVPRTTTSRLHAMDHGRSCATDEAALIQHYLAATVPTKASAMRSCSATRL